MVTPDSTPKGRILVNLDMKADLHGPSLELLEKTGTTGQVLRTWTIRTPIGGT